MRLADRSASLGRLVFAGGSGSATVTDGSGGTTLFGAAGGSVRYSGQTSGAVYVALKGNETLDASATAVGNTIFGGADPAGADVIVGGTGNDTFIAGRAAETFTGGGGTDQYFFVQSLTGGAGNAAVITDFATLTGSVALFGYNQSAGAVLNTAQSSGGNTTVTLSDNTRITFLGVSNPSALSGHLTSA